MKLWAKQEKWYTCPWTNRMIRNMPLHLISSKFQPTIVVSPKFRATYTTLLQTFWLSISQRWLQERTTIVNYWSLVNHYSLKHDIPVTKRESSLYWRDDQILITKMGQTIPTYFTKLKKQYHWPLFGKWKRPLIISNDNTSIKDPTLFPHKDPTLFPQGKLYLVDHQWQYLNQNCYSHLSTRKSVLSRPSMTILESKLLHSFRKEICTDYHQWQYFNPRSYSLSARKSVLSRPPMIILQSKILLSFYKVSCT